MTDQNATLCQEEFKEFRKIPRLSRECIITEKLDGTNGVVYVTEAGEVFAGSRNRWISPNKDSFGFAAWVEKHREELLTLGPGRHYGEWWGSGIQRGYGLAKGEKRWSLFNTLKFGPGGDGALPPCCHLVPVLYRGLFDSARVEEVLGLLREHGSYAAPGFDKPEGVVIFHIAGNLLFKKTLEKDEEPKGAKT